MKRDIDFGEKVIVTLALAPFAALAVINLFGLLLWLFGVMP